MMAISRKKVLQKIAGYRKGIDYHLDVHIPELIGEANQGLIEYWHKEVSDLIEQMERWVDRLSNNEELLAVAAEYRQRLKTVLDKRLDELAD